MAVVDGSDEVEEIHELSSKEHANNEIIAGPPNGPLSQDVYINRLHGKDPVPSLVRWTEYSGIRRKNRLLSNVLCQRCLAIGQNFLERLKSSKLEDSQVAVIRLPIFCEGCSSCSFFARWKVVRGLKYSNLFPFLNRFESPATQCFLVSLAAEHFGLASANHKFCIVTSKPYHQINEHTLRSWEDNQQCLLQMDTASLTPKDTLKHLPFGNDEYESISQWLRNCLASHREECPQKSLRNAFEMYCIDCEDKKVVLMPTEARYFALSYVWGHALASTEDDSLSNAPIVIKDAMIVTLRLSFRYLWVDRYCIDQRNPMQKHRQIANMSSIYAGATLTLIAAGDTDPEVGLPGVSSCRCNLDATLQLGSYSYVPLFGNPEVAIGRSKWSTRGWTYQEAIMSLRKLVFTSDGFYTQCNMQHSFGSSHPIGGQSVMSLGHANLRKAARNKHNGEPRLEVAPTVVFPGTDDGKPKCLLDGAIEEFYDHISKYMRRQLSFESDRLNAIQSVLDDFRSYEEPIFHVFGVPFKLFHSSKINYTLFWRMQSNKVHRRPGFPSWSWLGWQYDDEIPHQPIIIGDLETKPFIDGTFSLTGSYLSLDEHSARISVELPGGELLNLTDGFKSNKALDIALPREARILPHLLIRGVIFPLIFEQNEEGEWLYIGNQIRPFCEDSFGFSLRFKMWLDRPAADEQDALQQNQVKALVLGRSGLAIWLLILRKYGNRWSRIGVGQYSYQTSIKSSYLQVLGLQASDKAYFKMGKRYKKRTIRLD